MSALYRLKAYFGMVPAEELDDFAHGEYGHDDFEPEYEPDYARAGRPSRQAERRDRPDRPERLTTRAGARWAEVDEREVDRYPGGRRRGDDYYHEEPETPAARERAHRRGWTADAPPVRGSLAVDPSHEARVQQRTRPAPVEDAHPFARITTLHPRTFGDARTIGEHYRDGIPVIINLTEMVDADARRLVDFAAGLAFALRGSMDKVTTKVFLISPPDVDVTAEDKRRIAEGNLPRH